MRRRRDSGLGRVEEKEEKEEEEKEDGGEP